MILKLSFKHNSQNSLTNKDGGHLQAAEDLLCLCKYAIRQKRQYFFRLRASHKGCYIHFLFPTRMSLLGELW